MKNKWKSTGSLSGNCVLHCEGFYISYAPNPGCGLSFFSSDDGAPETALCITSDDGSKFMILNGDFRKEYEELAEKGLSACIDFFEKNKEAQSSWSSDTVA